MPWFKVDDDINSNYKMIGLSSAALALWLRTGAWAAKEMTDGFVPTHVIHHLCPPADLDAVGELIERNLWELHPDRDGIQFHDWAVYQPTREDVEERRRQWRERQDRSRSRRDSRGESRSHGSVTRDRNSQRYDQRRNGVTRDSRGSQGVPYPESPSGDSRRAGAGAEGAHPAEDALTRDEFKRAAEIGMEMIRAEWAKRRNAD
jgi:hypothetical protein